MGLLRTEQLVLLWCSTVLLLVEGNSVENTVLNDYHQPSTSKQAINTSTSQLQSVSRPPPLKALKPTCANLIETSVTSNHSIKSISFYLDQVVILYGETNESTNTYLYRFRPIGSTISNRTVPLSGINFEHADVLQDGPLVELFEGVAEYVDKSDIIQLVYVQQEMVVIFFRDPWEVFFVTFFRGKKVQQDRVVSETGLVSHSVLLYHHSEDIPVNVTNATATAAAIPTYFITLDDPSYQEGTMSLSMSDRVVHLFSHQSRLFGTSQLPNNTITSSTATQHIKLYLVVEHKHFYSDFIPLHLVLNMQMWRAALFHSYLYLLSGDKAGRVFYFKMENLSKHDNHFNLVMSMGNMSYGHFFGCKGEDPEETAIFPPEVVLEHARGLGMTFFYYLLALVAMIILLAIIIIFYYNPSQRIARMYSSTYTSLNKPNSICPASTNSDTTTSGSNSGSTSDSISSSTQASAQTDKHTQSNGQAALPPSSVKCRRHGYKRCHCTTSQVVGHCRSKSPATTNTTIDSDNSAGPPTSIQMDTLTTPIEMRLHCSNNKNLDI